MKRGYGMASRKRGGRGGRAWRAWRALAAGLTLAGLLGAATASGQPTKGPTQAPTKAPTKAPPGSSSAPSGATGTGGGGGSGTPSGDGSAAVIAEVDALARAGDQRGVEERLRRVLSEDAALGQRLCLDLLASERPSERLLGAGLLGSALDAKGVAELASRLNAAKCPDERRFLVRAIGPKAQPGGRERAALIEPFLRDRDAQVRAAAFQALADTGGAETVEWLAKELRQAPLETRSWSGGDNGVVQMSAWGAVTALTGLPMTNQRDVRDWLKAHLAAAKEAPDHEKPWLKSGQPGGEGPGGAALPFMEGERLVSRRFGVSVQVEDLTPPKKDGGASVKPWMGTLDAAADRAVAGSAPVFGIVHLPVIGLVFCDDRSFASFGGTSKGYFGLAQNNRVVIRFEGGKSVASVLIHEYVHIVHQSQFSKQPRWIMEGVAESLARSPVSSVFASMSAEDRRGFMVLPTKGLLATITRWDTGGNTGGERDQYTQAFIAIDFLRHSGRFSLPGLRLAALMGRLERGETAGAALEAVYGMKMEDLDRQVARWWASMPVPDENAKNPPAIKGPGG